MNFIAPRCAAPKVMPWVACTRNSSANGGSKAVTVQRIRRLRQRVVEQPGFVAPRWQDDDHFDLDFHVRHLSLPAPGSRRRTRAS